MLSWNLERLQCNRASTTGNTCGFSASEFAWDLCACEGAQTASSHDGDCFGKIQGCLIDCITQSEVHRQETNVKGKFLPLSVWASKGYNTDAIEAKAEKRSPAKWGIYLYLYIYICCSGFNRFNLFSYLYMLSFMPLYTLKRYQPLSCMEAVL